MTCPFCESEDVELVSPWGGQIITSQMRCRACNTYFEAIRDEFAGVPGKAGTVPGDAETVPGEADDRFRGGRHRSGGL